MISSHFIQYSFRNLSNYCPWGLEFDAIDCNYVTLRLPFLLVDSANKCVTKEITSHIKKSEKIKAANLHSIKPYKGKAHGSDAQK